MKKELFIVAIIISMNLTACAKVPDTVILDGVEVATDKQTDNDVHEITKEQTDLETGTTENYMEVTSGKVPVSEYNMQIIEESDGKHIIMNVEMMLGKQLTVDAEVNVRNVEKVSAYDYIITDISDADRIDFFDAYFGDRADEAVYDERSGIWKLVNSTASVADYYSYNVIFPIPAAVESQEKIVFFYHKPNLNPFVENRLESVSMSECVLSVNDAVRLCDELVNQVESFEGLQVDFIHAYGSEGRTPYYRLMYKRVLDGMYVNGYDDVFFLVDDNGIEKIMGAPYGVEEVEVDEQIITAYEAADIIAANGQLISSDKPLTVSEITMEYCAVKKTAYEIWIVPVWRFCLGADEDEANIMRTEILAVNAYTGELIHEKRGDIFE